MGAPLSLRLVWLRATLSTRRCQNSGKIRNLHHATRRRNIHSCLRCLNLRWNFLSLLGSLLQEGRTGADHGTSTRKKQRSRRKTLTEILRMLGVPGLFLKIARGPWRRKRQIVRRKKMTNLMEALPVPAAGERRNGVDEG